MTSSGQKIHHDSMTCAHRFFPFGTLLKVKNINNGKVVTVKVTDRGPFARGRIIDLSWGAARELGILNKGVAVVEVELLDGTVIPFRPKEEDNTILDLQLAGDDSYYAIPEWQSTGVTTKKLPLKMKK